MSAPIKDGGPAFPCQDPQAIHAVAAAAIANITDPDERDRAYIQARAEAVGGLSLRDYFAAKALAGLMARPGGINPHLDARLAYMLADAMLKARVP